MLSAELFPHHAQVHTDDMFRGMIGAISSEFQEALQWIFKIRQRTDTVLVTDGRSETARRGIRQAFEKEFETITLSYGSSTRERRPLAWMQEIQRGDWRGQTARLCSCLSQRLAHAIAGKSPVMRYALTTVEDTLTCLREYWRRFPDCSPTTRRTFLGEAPVGHFAKERIQKDIDQIRPSTVLG